MMAMQEALASMRKSTIYWAWALSGLATTAACCMLVLLPSDMLPRV